MDDLGICQEIIDSRHCGEVYCDILESTSVGLPELTAYFGLAPCLEIYTEINKEQAEVIAKRILLMDLAYDAELMSKAAAQSLAARFLAMFEQNQPRYYTNGTYYKDGPQGWTSATAATFDTGILIVGTSKAGCLWVADED